MTEDKTNDNSTDKQIDLIDLTQEEDMLDLKKEYIENTNQQSPPDTTSTSPVTTTTTTYRSQQMDSLKRDNKVLQKNNMEKRAKIARLNNKNRDLQNDNIQLKQTHEKTEKELNDLKYNFKEKLISFLNLERAESLSLDECLTRVKECLKKQNVTELNQRGETESQTTQENELNEKIKCLTDKLDEMKKRETDLEDKLSDLAKKNESLKNKVSELKSRKEDISVSFNEERQKSQKLSSIVDHYKRKTTSLFERISMLNSNLRTRSDVISRLKREKDEIMVELFDKKADLETTRSEINNLKRKIDDYDYNEDEVYNLKRKLTEAENEMKHLREINKKDIEIFAQTEKEFEEFKRENEAKLREKNETICSLNKEIENSKRETGSQLKELNALNESNEIKLNETIKNLNDKIQELITNEKQNEMKIEKLTKEANELKQELEKTKNNEKNQKEIDDMKEELKKKQYIVDGLSEKKNDFMLQLKREQELSHLLRLKLEKFDKLIKQTCTKYISIEEPKEASIKQEPMCYNTNSPRILSKRSLDSRDLNNQDEICKRNCI